MRIAISTIMDFPKSGAWHVVKNIILELKNIDKKNEYLIYAENNYKDYFGKMPNNFHVLRTSISAGQPIINILWHGFILPFLLIKEKIDVLYLPWHSVAFFIKTRPTVLSILDLTEYRLQNHYSKSRMLYRKTILPISSKLADRIVAISEYTKDDIVRFLKIAPRKIKIVYCAPNDQFRSFNDINYKNYLRDKYKLSGPFILYVGQIQHPNKNLVRLIRAFRKIKSDFGIKHKLVFVGKKHSSADIVYQTVCDFHLNEEIIFTGYVSDEDLPSFYNAADLFVYPSLYEGFGIPPLEAMACGCPVITSNTSSLPEVVGDAGILVDPNNVDKIAKAMIEILSNPEAKEEMIQKGFKQIKKYSWKDSASKTLEIFKDIKK